MPETMTFIPGIHIRASGIYIRDSGIHIRTSGIYIRAMDGMSFGLKKRISMVFRGENSPERYSYKED
jgi:hypothetical protein